MPATMSMKVDFVNYISRYKCDHADPRFAFGVKNAHFDREPELLDVQSLTSKVTGLCSTFLTRSEGEIDSSFGCFH